MSRGPDQSSAPWGGYTRVSKDRFIAEPGQLGVVEGRVFRTKVAAEAYYGTLKPWEQIVHIMVRPA